MRTNKLNTFYILYLSSLMLCVLIIFSCSTKPDYPLEPVLTFESVSKNSLIQGISSGIDTNIDSVLVHLSFTDGDGDIGHSIEDTITTSNIFVIDNRTGFEYTTFKLNEIPREGANNGVKGNIKLRILTTCCIFPDNIPPCSTDEKYPENQLSFDIYIVDRAGNISNTITTTNITLLCDN